MILETPPVAIRPRPKAPSVALWAFVAIVLAGLVTPIAAIVPLSFSASTIIAYPVRTLSLRWYADFFGNPLWTSASMTSLLLGAIVTVLATGLGIMAALGLRRLPGSLGRLIATLLMLPLVVPIILVAVAIFYLYARLGLVGDFRGLVLAHTILALPYVLVCVNASLASFDDTLLRAAASLGSSPIYSFFRVQLPVIRPGVISGALFAFITSFDELVVTLFVGGPNYRTLPRQIWSGVRESMSPTVMAAAVVLGVTTICAVGLVELMRSRPGRSGDGGRSMA
jgi:putative spermidine/putrescine transport system permease protein